MDEILLALGGLLFGIFFGLIALRWLLRVPPARVFIARLLNWTTIELPRGAKPVIRHGRWVPSEDEDFR